MRFTAPAFANKGLSVDHIGTGSVEYCVTLLQTQAMAPSAAVPLAWHLRRNGLIVSSDSGHFELDWRTTIGWKPFFVIGHLEDFTASADKNMNVRAYTVDRVLGDDTGDAGAQHFRPHAEGAHLCLQWIGGNVEVVLHHSRAMTSLQMIDNCFAACLDESFHEII
jgi:hypothetical protein